MDDQIHEEWEQIKKLEQKLGMPEGTYLGLKTEGSDWEFAIKLMVILESALGRVIAENLHNAAVSDHCQYLNINGRTGKVALAQSLKLIDDAEKKTFLALADIRNSFAHRLENIAGNLSDFASRMSADQLSKIFKACLTIPKGMDDDLSFLWKNPNPKFLRLYMWMGGNTILVSLAFHDQAAEVERARRAALETANQSANGSLGALAMLFQENTIAREEMTKSILGDDAH